jgi:hypothetical protein
VITIAFDPTVPAGTVTTKLVAEFDCTVAGAPPIVMLVTPDKFVPVIVAEFPPEISPELGKIEVMVGAGIYKYVSEAVTVPPAAIK